MNLIVEEIKDAAYRIPIEPNIDPYSYQQGMVAGRQQAIEIIQRMAQVGCDHIYGSSDGACLNCNFQA